MDDYHYVYEDDTIETAIQTVKDYDRKCDSSQWIQIITCWELSTADDILMKWSKILNFDYQRIIW